MGRGYQKAKQMKSRLGSRHFSPDTDLHALQRELADEDLHRRTVPWTSLKRTMVDDPTEIRHPRGYSAETTST